MSEASSYGIGGMSSYHSGASSTPYFVTTLADAIGAEETLQALQHAAGFLRSRLSHSLRVRQVPELRFVYDESVERGLHLSRLIDEATKPDGPAGRG